METGTVVQGLARRKPTKPGAGVLSFIVRLFREKPLGGFGALIVLTLFVLAVTADWVAPARYDELDLFNRLSAPGGSNVLGTDHLGRDILSRIIYGARISIYVGLGAVSAATFIKIFLGVISGWYGGRLDALIQRVVDAWIALPGLLILLSLSSIIGPGLSTMIFILSLRGISSSRVIRGTVLGVKANPYIDAAIVVGASTPRILMQHVLPNIIAPVIILATLNFGQVILAESSLSFLGFGIPPPVPSWGQMVGGDAKGYLYEAPWIVLWPGVALTMAVFGWNVFGDALRDLLDPRLRGSEKR